MFLACGYDSDAGRPVLESFNIRRVPLEFPPCIFLEDHGILDCLNIYICPDFHIL
jgi:hypothetical protein